MKIPPRCGSLLVAAAISIGFLSSNTAFAGLFTWTDVNGNWSDTNNWQGQVAPGGADNTDTLIFGGATASAYAATNDVTDLFLLNQILLTNSTSTTQTLVGKSVQFGGTGPQLLQNGAGQFAINNDINLAADTTLGGSGSGTVTLNGAITGNSALNVNGGGPFVLTGNNLYSGGTTITNGSLVVKNTAGSGTGGGDVSVNNLGHLSGSGTVSGNLNVNSGGLADGALTVGGNAIVTGGTLGGSGTVSGSVTINNAGLVNGNNTIGATTVNSGGVLTGNGTVTGDVQVNGGTVNGSRTIQGQATINTGGLMTGNGSVAGTVTVNSGGTLAGLVSVGTLNINSGGVLAPGTTSSGSPGTIFAKTTSLNGGGIYQWLLNDATGTAGQNPGWDQLDVNGNLNINSIQSDPFMIDLESLSGHNPGDPINWNYRSTYMFPIIAVTGGNILNFSPTDFTLDTSEFADTSPAFWSIAQVGSNIDLEYHGVPEPGLMSLLALGVILLLGDRLRRRLVSCRQPAL